MYGCIISRRGYKIKQKFTHLLRKKGMQRIPFDLQTKPNGLNLFCFFGDLRAEKHPNPPIFLKKAAKRGE